MRISPSCLNNLTIKKLQNFILRYLIKRKKKKFLYLPESFGGLFWKFLAASRRSTDKQLFGEGEMNIVK